MNIIFTSREVIKIEDTKNFQVNGVFVSDLFSQISNRIDVLMEYFPNIQRNDWNLEQTVKMCEHSAIKGTFGVHLVAYVSV